MAERQRIIESNRSLRTIKNELENLLERGAISEDTFDSISSLLPTEASLSGPTPRAASQNQASLSSVFAKRLDLNPAVPVVAAHSPAPPAYSETALPALPARKSPAGAPEKPVVAYARALYRYEAADARDVALERDDRVAVHDKVNAEWWMGRNLRTGAEGIFPKTYVVEQESEKRPPPPPVPMPRQSSATMEPVSTATLGNVGGPPPQQAPYSPNGGVDNGEGKSKMEGQGKKFGKKLGNAAIFGAGATIGGKIVNSIF